MISRLYRGVDHLRPVDNEDFSEGHSDRTNNATPRNRILWRELFLRSVASRPAHRDSWQALLMRMNDEMARRGLVVWWSPVVVRNRAVDELALRRPCAPCPLPLKLPFATHLRFPNPIVDPSSKPSAIPPLSSLFFQLSFFPTLSETVSLLYLFFSTIITLPGMSAASLAGPDLHPELLPFIIVFHDILRFFLPRSSLRFRAELSRLKVAGS